jgi:hypothetical protein
MLFAHGPKKVSETLHTFRDWKSESAIYPFSKADFRIERLSWWENSRAMTLMGKLFGRTKAEPVEVKPSISFASEKLFHRATKRIFAKYKATIRKLEP